MVVPVINTILPLVPICTFIDPITWPLVVSIFTRVDVICIVNGRYFSEIVPIIVCPSPAHVNWPDPVISTLAKFPSITPVEDAIPTPEFAVTTFDSVVVGNGAKSLLWNNF